MEPLLLAEIISLIEAEFFDVSFLAEEWPSIRRLAEREYRSATSVEEKQRVVEHLLSSLNVSHTMLLTPEMQREISKVESESSTSGLELIENRSLLYARVSSFQVPALGRSERNRLGESLQNVDRLILDLRLNGGGSLSAATAFASLFLPVGTPIARVRDREGSEIETGIVSGAIPEEQNRDHTYEIDLIKSHHHVLFQILQGEETMFSGEIILLVGKNCHSSGEVFVQVMKENGRATVIGTASAGAVVGAMVHDLSDDFAVLLPFASIESGAGRVLEGKGVEPDVAIDLEGMSYLEIVDLPELKQWGKGD